MGQVGELEYEAEMLRKSASMIRRHLQAHPSALLPASRDAWLAVAESKERLAAALTLPALLEQAA